MPFVKNPSDCLSIGISTSRPEALFLEIFLIFYSKFLTVTGLEENVSCVKYFLSILVILGWF